MSSDTEPEKKPDSGAPKVMPEPEVVEQTEFTIKVSCQKTANGARSCKIQEITEIYPAKDPVIVAPVEIPKADTPVDAAVTPADSPKCDICEIIADIALNVKDNKTFPKDDDAPQVAGRRNENRHLDAPRRLEKQVVTYAPQWRLPEWVYRRDRSRRLGQRSLRSI